MNPYRYSTLSLAVLAAISASASAALPILFGPPTPYAVGVTLPINPVSGDFNGDGRADLLINSLTGNTSGLLLGNGDGTFQPVQVVVSGFSLEFALGDFNGDGRLDFASTVPALPSSTSGSLNVVLNDGAGGFLAPVIYPAGGHPREIIAADLNGDGILDLAVANGVDGGSDEDPPYTNDGTISVLIGNGDGTFNPRRVFVTADNPWSLRAADLDGDGDLDLAIAHISANIPEFVGLTAASVMFNDGDGFFTLAPVFLRVGISASTMEVADLNGDTFPDLIVSNLHHPVTGFDPSAASVFLNDGKGWFLPEALVPVGDRPTSIVVADLNGDQVLDLAINNGGVFFGSPIGWVGRNVSLLVGNGDGTFKPATVIGEGALPLRMTGADVDGNGTTDLVTSDIDNALVNVFLNQLVPPPDCQADANGDGATDGADLSVLLGQFGESVGPGTGADFNGDGVVNGADLSVLLGGFGCGL